MFRFSRGFRGADFGSLGEEGDAVEKNSNSGDVSEEGKGAGKGFLQTIAPILSTVTPLMQSAGLCGCANKKKDAEANKKAELSRKFPFRDCDKNVVDYDDCVKFNADQKRKQDKEYASWLESDDAKAASQITPAEKDKLAALNLLAKDLKALHPEAGNMSISQLMKKYPADFDRAYKAVQMAYPFLKNVPAEMALAMAPGVSNMKLDDLIKQLDNVTKGSPVAQKAGLGSVLMVVLGGAVVGAVIKRFK
jgi:hypothetical protein